MTDSRAKIDLVIYQMVDFKEEFVLMLGEPPVEADLKLDTMTMQVRRRDGAREVLAIFDSALTSDPAHEPGKPLKGRILLADTSATADLGKYTLSMQETHTKFLCPDGKAVDAEYDIIHTDANGNSRVVQYGVVKCIPSPSRPDTVI